MTPTAADVARALRRLGSVAECLGAHGVPLAPCADTGEKLMADLALLRAALDGKDAEIVRLTAIEADAETARVFYRHGTPFDPSGVKNAMEITAYREQDQRLRALLADRERMGKIAWDADSPPVRWRQWADVHEHEGFKESWLKRGDRLAAALSAALDGTEGA